MSPIRFGISLILLLIWMVCLTNGRTLDLMPYEFYHQTKCSLKTLNISMLNGDWFLVYYNDKVNKEIKLNFNKTATNTVLVETKEDGKLVKSVNLTQSEQLSGKLVELVDMGTWQMAIPWFVLYASSNSLAIYHGTPDSRDKWAIYSRTKTMSDEDYTKSNDAFKCAKLKHRRGKPLTKLTVVEPDVYDPPYIYESADCLKQRCHNLFAIINNLKQRKLLTGHINDRSNSMIYPYFNQEHCTVKSLDISSLAGDWYLLYSKNPVHKEIKLKFLPTSTNTVTVETRENGNLIKTTKLTQNPNLAGKLEELKNMGTWTAGIPWFILDVRPGQSSMAIYHGSMSSTTDEYWAIYSKSKTLASADYTASIDAFNCAHLKNNNGNPIVIKATF